MRVGDDHDPRGFNSIDNTEPKPTKQVAARAVIESRPRVGQPPDVRLVLTNSGIGPARICYCSVFDECWIGSGQTTHADRVASCPAPPVSYQVSAQRRQ